MTGRPTLYTAELGREICDQLESGRSLRAICEASGMPDERTVRRWASDPAHPFSPHYVRAREVGYLILADELLEIADDGRNDYVTKSNKDGSTYEAFDGEHVQRSRLRVDTRKWLLAKMLPKVFGEKVSAEVTGKDGAPLLEPINKLDLVRRILHMVKDAQDSVAAESQPPAPKAE